MRPVERKAVVPRGNGSKRFAVPKQSVAKSKLGAVLREAKVTSERLRKSRTIDPADMRRRFTV